MSPRPEPVWEELHFPAFIDAAGNPIDESFTERFNVASEYGHARLLARKAEKEQLYAEWEALMGRPND